MKDKPSLNDIETFNKKREQDNDQEVSLLEGDSTISESNDPNEGESEILNITKSLKNKLEIITKELFKVKAQVKAHKYLLDKQDKEISLLKNEGESSLNLDEEEKKLKEADLVYNKNLILRNIVFLKEEKEFSNNDVARLFKLEGFPPPSPDNQWNTKIVEKLYQIAKKKD